MAEAQAAGDEAATLALRLLSHRDDDDDAGVDFGDSPEGIRAITLFLDKASPSATRHFSSFLDRRDADFAAFVESFDADTGEEEEEELPDFSLDAFILHYLHGGGDGRDGVGPDGLCSPFN